METNEESKGGTKRSANPDDEHMDMVKPKRKKPRCESVLLAERVTYLGKAARDQHRTDMESRATEFRIVYKSDAFAIKRETLKSSEFFAAFFDAEPDAKQIDVEVPVPDCTKELLQNFLEMLCIWEESSGGVFTWTEVSRTMLPGFANCQVLWQLAAYFGHAELTVQFKGKWWRLVPWTANDYNDEATVRKSIAAILDAVRFASDKLPVFALRRLLGWIHMLEGFLLYCLLAYLCFRLQTNKTKIGLSHEMLGIFWKASKAPDAESIHFAKLDKNLQGLWHEGLSHFIVGFLHCFVRFNQQNNQNSEGCEAGPFDCGCLHELCIGRRADDGRTD